MRAIRVTVVCGLLAVAALGAWPWLQGSGQTQADVAHGTPADSPAQAPEQVQVIRCVDESGRPVRGATVELVPASTRDGHLRTETSDDLGLTTFRNLREGRYTVRATAGHRHHVPTVDTARRTLPDGEMDIVLSELWVGGLELQGARAVNHASELRGFRRSQDEAVEQALVAELQRQHPQAVFWAMFRDHDRDPSESIRVTVDWVGHATHRQDLRMGPVSQFQGPEVLAPDAVPRRDWAEVRVVLVDAQGRELAPGIRKALQGRIDLVPAPPESGSLAAVVLADPMPLPVGEYLVRRYDPAHANKLPVGRCTVSKDARELRVPLHLTDRLVRLHLQGAGNAYVLRVVHESGRALQEIPAKEGRHALFLPQGPCVASVHRLLADGNKVVDELAIVVTGAPEQDLAWELPVRN